MRTAIAFAVLALAASTINAESTITSTINCLAYLAADIEFKKAEDEYRAIENDAYTDAEKYMRQEVSTVDDAFERIHHAALDVQREAHKAADEAFKRDSGVYDNKRRAENTRLDKAYREAYDRADNRYRAASDAFTDTWDLRPRDKAKENAAKAAMLRAKKERDTIERGTPRPITPSMDQIKKVLYEAKADADRIYNASWNAAAEERRSEYERIERTANEMLRSALAPSVPSYEEAISHRIHAYVAAYANPGPGLQRDVSGYDKELVFTMAESQRRLCPEAP